jgi:hypothetical protein
MLGMSERFTGIPEHLKASRETASRAERKQAAQESQTVSAAKTPEQTGSPTREDIHNASLDMQRRFRSSRRGTLTEIRDLLRRQEISRELEEMAAFSASFNENFNKKREETLTSTQEGGEKITVGKLILSILAGLLSMPAEVAEQAANEAKRQAEQAAS